jgi:hypothetical protein
MHAQLLFCLALGSSLYGCTSWQVPEVPPELLMVDGAGHRVRVTRNDGSHVVLAQARVTPAGVSGKGERMPIVVPAREIRELAVRREDPSRTVALIGGLVGVIGVAGAVAINAGEAPSNVR